MSDTPLDRPATLKRAPRPAPDDDIDPVDTRPIERDPRPASTLPADTEPAALSYPPAPGGDAPTPAWPAAAARPAPPFPFSTRIAPDVRDILDAVKALGHTERAAVEKAIREYWGRRVQPPS